MKPKQEDAKRAYEKPKLRVIELNVDEVLGIGCKLSSGGGMAIGAVPCTLNSCVTAGS